ISTYFLIWVLNPYDDFPKYVYHIVFALSAIFIAYSIYLLNNFIADIVMKASKKYNILRKLYFRNRISQKELDAFDNHMVDQVKKEMWKERETNSRKIKSL
ncbi:MAG: hypothetical protein AAF934_10965, partial [Bacteroidota bacterium]